MMPSPDPTIRIAAALLCRPGGHTLLVRKRGTSAFMQPGGKIETGEAPLAALLRELREELSLAVMPSQARYLGCFRAPAAHEPGWTVEAEIFRIDIDADVQPAAEIEELVWIAPSAASALVLAPLTRDHVLPLHAVP